MIDWNFWMEWIWRIAMLGIGLMGLVRLSAIAMHANRIPTKKQQKIAGWIK